MMIPAAPLLLGGVNLHRAMAAAVARDDHAAAHVHARGSKALVVRRQPVIHVHHGRGDGSDAE